MKTLWDTRIEQANVKHRLLELGMPKTIIYAMGCVTHSRDVILTSQPSPLHQAFQTMTGLLDDFWRSYPNSLSSTSVAASLQRATDLLPNEEERVDCMFAEDVLMDGIVYALTLATMSAYSENAESLALNAIDRAYIFVYTFHHELDSIVQSEEEVRKVEMNSKYCSDEIAFQLAFLAALERTQGQPPTYASILLQSNLGHN